jgi:hypothetical protein
LASRPEIIDGRAVGELVRCVVERLAGIDVLVADAGAPPALEELDGMGCWSATSRTLKMTT